MMGKTLGPLAIEVEKHLRSFWAESGFKIVKESRDGMLIEKPDYWVIRVSVLDMPHAKYERLLRLTERAQHKDLLGKHRTIAAYLKERRNAEAMDESKKYVNFAGGPKAGTAIQHVAGWLETHGFRQYCQIVPGPLFRATANGKADTPTDMPLSTSSSYTHLASAQKKSYDIIQASDEPDTELDLEGLDVPKFGNHGNRRYADKKALETAAITGVSREIHDDHFGWAQKQRRKESALHYHGRTERLKRAKVTSML